MMRFPVDLIAFGSLVISICNAVPTGNQRTCGYEVSTSVVCEFFSIPCVFIIRDVQLLKKVR